MSRPVRGSLFLWLACLAATPQAQAKRNAARTQAVNLPAGRWVETTRKELGDFIFRHGKTAPGYSSDNPPAAVLIWDDVSVIGNAGESAFRRLVNRAEFKFGDPFWALIPPPYRRRAVVGYGGFKDQPAVVWPKDPYYQMYRKAMFRAYQDLCRDRGKRFCATWLTELLMGFDETEVIEYMQQVVEESLKEPVGSENIVEGPGDDLPVQVPTGLRVIPEMAALCKILRQSGFDVWILSSSNFWAARAFSARYGIDPEHVVGVRSRVVNRFLQPEIVDPVPIGTGEAEAATTFIGHGPELAAGGEEDTALFEYGPGLRLAIVHGDEKFRVQAANRGWLVQPMFKPISGGNTP